MSLLQQTHLTLSAGSRRVPLADAATLQGLAPAAVAQLMALKKHNVSHCMATLF